MDNNPYAPPAPGGFASPLPVQLADGELHYAGFWQRFLGYWLDALVMLPLTGVYYLLSEKSRLFMLYWAIPGLVIGLLFHVYLVKRYGGTPGKLIMKTRIAMVDGAPVTTRAAALRYAVLFVLTTLTSVALCMGVLSMSDSEYFSLGYLARSTRMVELAPKWYYVVSILLQIWIWGEFITMLFNKKRRAVHDFIAGTVVLRTTPKA